LIANGVDEKKRIVGTEALSPFLYNLPKEYVERFRSQITLVDVQFQGDPGIIRNAVWSCYQEEPVEFRGYTLYDTGAYPEAPLSGEITFRVTQPWSEPIDDSERKAREKALALMERLRNRNKAVNV